MPAPDGTAAPPGRARGPYGRRGPRQNDQPCPIPLQVRTKVWLERDGAFVIGDGGLRLLLAMPTRARCWPPHARSDGPIVTPGSTCGGRRVSSARPWWRRDPGKGARRGTALTPDGQRMLALLREARAAIDRVAGESGPRPSNRGPRRHEGPGASFRHQRRRGESAIVESGGAAPARDLDRDTTPLTRATAPPPPRRPGT